MPIVVASSFPPEIGGIQRYCESIARALNASRGGVVVVAPKAQGADAFDRAASFRIVRYASGSSRIGAMVSLWISVIGVSLRNPSFVVASSWFPSGLCAHLIPPPLRRRVLVIAHGTEVSPSRRGFHRLVKLAVYNRADAVIAVSDTTRKMLLRAGVRPELIHVVHCGIDVLPPVVGRPDRQIILATGRLIERKGFDRLVESMPTILREFPQATLRIVGDGPQREALERRCEHLGVTAAVCFRGSIDDRELQREYREASCFALPVRAIGDDIEGFGIVYLEAAMAGLPVLGGRNSGAEAAIADGVTGLLVDGNDSHAIARAIGQFFRDPDDARRMGERGRERAIASFSWASVAEVIERIGTSA